MLLVPSDAGATATLTVSPARIVVRLQPTQTIAQPIAISNEGDVPLTIYADFRDLRRTIGDTDTLEFVTGGIQPDSIADWLTAIPQRFELQPGQSQLVTVDVRPRPSEAPGMYQGAVFFVGQTSGDPSESVVSLYPEVGLVLLATLEPQETVYASALGDTVKPNFWNLAGLIALGIGGGILIGIEVAVHRKRRR